MNTLRLALTVAVTLFAASIAATARAQVSFHGDGYVVVTSIYNINTTTGSGSTIVTATSVQGGVSALLGSGSGSADVKMLFGTDIVQTGSNGGGPGRTKATVQLFPESGGQVDNTSTGYASGYIQSDDVGVSLNDNTNNHNPFGFSPSTPSTMIAPRQITFTAEATVSDSASGTSDQAQTIGYFSIF